MPRNVNPGRDLAAQSGWRAFVLAGLLSLLAALAPATAQPRATSLQDLAAAYILKFSTFVQWPAQAFRTPSDPVILGVMDDPELAQALRQAVRGKQVEGRPLLVRELAPSDPVRGLHVLVLPQAGHPARQRVERELAGLPILTVATPQRGRVPGRGAAMVQLVLENDRLRFDVGMPPRELGLRISALMLSAARRVDRMFE